MGKADMDVIRETAEQAGFATRLSCEDKLIISYDTLALSRDVDEDVDAEMWDKLSDSLGFDLSEIQISCGLDKTQSWIEVCTEGLDDQS